jgi:hypothetical protein
MKVKYFILALLSICFWQQNAVAQTPNAEADVTVSESVLKTASWANFKYLDQLAMAKRGDVKAALKLMQFSGTVDGVEALDHSVTLLELIVSGGDQVFAEAANQAKPKLKSVLLDRLQLAQGRTKKVELREPMSAWAPSTWDVLNGKPFVKQISAEALESCLKSHEPGGVVTKPGQEKTASDVEGAKTAAPAADGTKGNQ